MKKIFTLIASAAVAISAAAQGTYQYASETAIPAGTTVDAVPNCTLTFGAAGGADFKAAKTANNIEGYTAFCEGNGENGNYKDGAPVGTCYELKPAISGKITVAVVLNANKAFFICEDGVALPDFNGIKVDPKYYGTYTFDVVGGKTYDVYCTGSKLGFFGFEYEATATPEPVEGETLGVIGYGSGTFGSTYDNIVTPFDFDAATKVLTLKDFLGTQTTVKLQFEISDPNKDPNGVETVYNSVAVSGLGEGDANTGCTIDNYNGPFIIKKDGVDFGKLENVKFYPGYSTQMEIAVEGTGATAQKVYSFKIRLGGDFSLWNAETSTWVPSRYDWQTEKWLEEPGMNFIALTKIIPFAGPAVGIESVAVDFDENAPVEYYNLNGVRVENPANGLFIMRQGNKVVKVVK